MNTNKTNMLKGLISFLWVAIGTTGLYVGYMLHNQIVVKDAGATWIIAPTIFMSVDTAIELMVGMLLAIIALGSVSKKDDIDVQEIRPDDPQTKNSNNAMVSILGYMR